MEGQRFACRESLFLCLICACSASIHVERCAEMGGGRGPLQPAGPLPQGTGGGTEVCPERMAEFGHPGQVDALCVISPLTPVPYV